MEDVCVPVVHIDGKKPQRHFKTHQARLKIVNCTVIALLAEM